MARLSLWDRLWLWWENICPKHLKPKTMWTGNTFPGTTKECSDCREKRFQREDEHEREVEQRINLMLDAIRAKSRAAQGGR